MVLVDSSFWIRFEHGSVHFDDFVPEDEVVATCPVVWMEMLRGASDPKHYALTLDLLFNVEMLDSPMPLERFQSAAKLYLACRVAGVTPSTSDCLIAATAMHYGVPLLHMDSDFDDIARVAPLKIFTRS